MRRIASIALFVTALAANGLAQQWEFGGVGGAGFLSNVNVTAPAGSATAGFQTGAVGGVFLGQHLYTHLGGELRYEYMQNNLQIQSGGTTASFAGSAHAVHYDLVWRFSGRESRTQPFVALGGGLKIYRGSGAEQAYQPNYQFGYLTKTQQLEPMGDIGVGVRFMLKPRLFLRAEIRDFITPFPSQVIAAAPGAKFGSILHDVVPMIGIAYEN